MVFGQTGQRVKQRQQGGKRHDREQQLRKPDPIELNQTRKWHSGLLDFIEVPEEVEGDPENQEPAQTESKRG